MLLQKADQPFNDSDFITELKMDGIRLILSKFQNKIRLYTRHKNEVTAKFPELCDINLPDCTVLDGELIVPDINGKPVFEDVMERFMSKKADHFIQFCVFDIIYYKGKKVTGLSLMERKQLLLQLNISHKHIVTSQFIEAFGIQYFDLVKEQGLEGIVLKRKDSIYQINKRSYDWLKVINYQYSDVYITGLRNDEFGLVLSSLDGKYLGIMEFMPPEDRKRLYTNKKVVETTDKYTKIEPIKCQVKYRELTKNRLLRIPSFHKWIM